MVEFRTSVQRDVQAAGHTRCDDSFVGSSPKSTSASPPASPSSSSARKALLPARARLPPSPPDGLPLRAEVEKSSALDSVLEKRRRGGGLEGGGGGASRGTRGLVESGTVSQSGGTPRLWTRLVSGVEMERRCLRRCLGSVSEVSGTCHLSGEASDASDRTLARSPSGAAGSSGGGSSSGESSIASASSDGGHQSSATAGMPAPWTRTSQRGEDGICKGYAQASTAEYSRTPLQPCPLER